MARRSVNIFINGKQVGDQLKTIRGEGQHLEKTLQGMTEGTKEYAATSKKLSEVNKSIAQQEEALLRAGKAITINGKVVVKNIKAIQGEARLLARGLNNMVEGSEEYVQTSKELARVNGVLKSHRARVNGVGSAWQKLKSGIDRYIGLAAAAFTATAIIGYGKELFRLGVEMDTLSRKAQTVFGSALPLVTAAANENATAMGLTTAKYVNAAAAIGDLLIPMGFTREEAARNSTALVDLSGALAEWTGGQKSAEEVTQILGKAILGEREQLKTLGIGMLEADVKARVAEKGLDKLTGAMLQQAKAAATLELITEKSRDAQTAFANNNDSLIRKQAELSAKVKDTAERLSKALLPVFERILHLAGQLTDGIGRLIGNFTSLQSPLDKAKSSVYGLQSAFNSEVNTLKALNPESEQRGKLIAEINRKYGAYLPNLLSEKATLDEITKAQTSANNAFQQKILLLSFEEERIPGVV